MSIKIFSTLTRKKEEFIPLEKGKVSMYVCGPTVYNHIHIGNSRPAIFFDTVRKYFQYRGYEVRYIQNFTDVDDKIIRAANEMGISAKEVSERFIDSYFHYVEQLGVEKATVHPKVTENMNEIIQFIQQLVDQGLAYEANGDVYFRTKKFDQYGKLSQQRTEELIEGVRIEVGEQKESALDFALWKKSKPNEVAWESPWGSGRPGWHIECSAMIKRYLGETIDIHGGGIDLTFPHHENEIAQTESLTNRPLANYWMHTALLMINSQKMSKSLGNFILINDVLESHAPQVVRFFMLSGHYRSPMNYSEELLEQAKNGLDRLRTAATNLNHKIQFLEKLQQVGISEQEAGKEEENPAHAWRNRFVQAMDDDFNTANAISILFELAKVINQYANRSETNLTMLKKYKETFLELGEILGLQLEEEEILAEEIEQLIEERKQARQMRNFERSDQIRDYLLERGIIVEDTPQGIRWRRK